MSVSQVVGPLSSPEPLSTPIGQAHPRGGLPQMVFPGGDPRGAPHRTIDFTGGEDFGRASSTFAPRNQGPSNSAQSPINVVFNLFYLRPPPTLKAIPELRWDKPVVAGAIVLGVLIKTPYGHQMATLSLGALNRYLSWVTERRIGETRLQAYERRMDSLFDGCPDDKDSAKSRFREVSHRYPHSRFTEGTNAWAFDFVEPEDVLRTFRIVGILNNEDITGREPQNFEEMHGASRHRVGEPACEYDTDAGKIQGVTVRGYSHARNVWGAGYSGNASPLYLAASAIQKGDSGLYCIQLIPRVEGNTEAVAAQEVGGAGPEDGFVWVDTDGKLYSLSERWVPIGIPVEAGVPASTSRSLYRRMRMVFADEDGQLERVPICFTYKPLLV